MEQPAGPALELVEDGDSKLWHIDLKNFAKFREAIGPDVLAAFACCFVHADRLTSMISFAFVSLQYHGRDSVAYGRDLHTMVWFTVGTLRELATAIRDVRSALAKRGLLDPNSGPWLQLRDVEKRWEDDPFFRNMRNVAAFHVDFDVIEKGIQVLADSRDAVLCTGDSPKGVDCTLTLGFEALHNGLGIEPDAYRDFLEKVSDDHGVRDAIQEAFVLAADAAGIPRT